MPAVNAPSHHDTLSHGMAMACQSVNTMHSLDPAGQRRLVRLWAAFTIELGALGVRVDDQLGDPFGDPVDPQGVWGSTAAPSA